MRAKLGGLWQTCSVQGSRRCPQGGFCPSTLPWHALELEHPPLSRRGAVLLEQNGDTLAGPGGVRTGAAAPWDPPRERWLGKGQGSTGQDEVVCLHSGAVPGGAWHCAGVPTVALQKRRVTVDTRDLITVTKVRAPCEGLQKELVLQFGQERRWEVKSTGVRYTWRKAT